jgi:hypothetical protein
VPGDKAAKDRLAELPVFVPAADLEKAKQEAAAAEAAQTAEVKAEEAKGESYRSQYPGRLHFDYAWDAKKARELGLQQIWHDDKFMRASRRPAACTWDMSSLASRTATMIAAAMTAVEANFTLMRACSSRASRRGMVPHG